MAVTINADNGVSSGSAGLKQTADSTGVLALQTNGTTAVTVDTSQNVGIGTSSPSSPLTMGNNKRIAALNTGAATVNLALLDGSNNVYLGDFSTNSSSTYLSGASNVIFGTGNSNTERMRINSSGNVGIGTSSPATNFVLSSASAAVGGDNLQNMQVVYTGTAAENCGYTAKNYYGTSQFFQWNNNGTRLGNRIVTNGGSGVLSFTYGNDTEGMRLDGNGYLLIGTTSTSNPPSQGISLYGSLTNAQLAVGHATGTTGGQYYLVLGYNGTTIGGIVQNGTTAVQYNTTSDYRLKENVQPIVGALARVAALNPVTYTWKAAPDEMGEGFIAHELAEVCPQAVSGEKDGIEVYTDEDGNEQTKPKYQGIDTSFLVATLTAAIQELNAKFEAYKATHP
jgi:hypothetical protein